MLPWTCYSLEIFSRRLGDPAEESSWPPSIPWFPKHTNKLLFLQSEPIAANWERNLTLWDWPSRPFSSEKATLAMNLCVTSEHVFQFTSHEVQLWCHIIIETKYFSWHVHKTPCHPSETLREAAECWGQQMMQKLSCVVSLDSFSYKQLGYYAVVLCN